MNRIIYFFLNNKLVTSLLLILIIVWGIVTMPFGSKPDFLPNDPVAVDAIPNIGENQQIVYTRWEGRSPQDIEDQITYPLTTTLLGVPGVKSIRSSSMLGRSNIYVIFEEDIEFYWSRSRILEKLNALPSNLLPKNVSPALGPDATGLGQVFWYTLEGRDSAGNATGGWDPQELRTIQDFQVKYALASTPGVSEVASIGGFVKEYKVKIQPEQLEHYNISLKAVVGAARKSNREVGAKTLEINKVEYFVRGLGYVDSLEDIANTVIKTVGNTPIRIKDVAVVKWGPADRRGMLDKNGVEAVGGVVTARYGENPMKVIRATKDKIDQISSGLPQKTLDNGVESQVNIVPFYDRSELIQETLGTLNHALTMEILITILVILIMVMNLRISIVVASLLPISVLMVFIAMRYFHVDANIVALSGIAIAIGTMIDLGIILTENILRHLRNKEKNISLKEVVFKASSEVSSAILTAVMTTIISFIPVFMLQGAEGKLFAPLAYTKTFALVAALLVSLLILPSLAHAVFKFQPKKNLRLGLHIAVTLLGFLLLFYGIWGDWVLLALGVIGIADYFNLIPKIQWWRMGIILIAVCQLLAYNWLPLGPQQGIVLNFIFVVLLIGLILSIFQIFIYYYNRLLVFFLNHKIAFLLLPLFTILVSIHIWFGFSNIWGVDMKEEEKNNNTTNILVERFDETFPGIGQEFMPTLNEGTFLLMPTTTPHVGMEKSRDILRQLDEATMKIPEVKMAVGKAGRALTALDPAPISMYENIIQYYSEYKLDKNGHRQRFSINDKGFYQLKSGRFKSDSLIRTEKWQDSLVADENGMYFRNWRKSIQSKNDIWAAIRENTQLPGVTSAPKLQPIETRLVMLQTGMRAPMGIKVYGQDLAKIGAFGQKLERILKNVKGIKKESVAADRVVGKPYLEIDVDRSSIARYNLTMADVQNVIKVAIGGENVATTVKGRERYNINVRYPRAIRNQPDELRKIQIPTGKDQYIPLEQIADITFRKGPQNIKSEDNFLVGYVLFDKEDEVSQGEIVTRAQKAIGNAIDGGAMSVPAGISYAFSGDYKNQIRAEKRLSITLPIVLIIIFLILYFQFRSAATAFMVFSGIMVAFSGGFIMLWLYGSDGFMDFSVFGTSMRNLFQIQTINLSVAVWVGFIALFGIATDDGVVMATYLDQSFKKNQPTSKKEIRAAVVEAGLKRVRPCLMTTATTLIALLPILTSSGKGSNIMIPMAIPTFGGMVFALLTLFVVPVLYAGYHELKLRNDE